MTGIGEMSLFNNYFIFLARKLKPDIESYINDSLSVDEDNIVNNVSTY